MVIKLYRDIYKPLVIIEIGMPLLLLCLKLLKRNKIGQGLSLINYRKEGNILIEKNTSIGTNGVLLPGIRFGTFNDNNSLCTNYND